MGESGDADEQQRALEQALRIEQLEATVEALRSERAATLEHLRVVRAHTGLEGAAREVKSRAKARLAELRRRAPEPSPSPAVPLASLPVTASNARPVWQPAVDLAGDVRSALIAEPPTRLRWQLELPAGAAVRGAAGLRPGAWDMNRGGVDLVVTASLQGAAEPAASLVLGVDPGARVADRRWVPWRLDLPAGLVTLTIEVRPGADATPDYAWAVVGEPELELPGLAPRAPLGPAAAVAPSGATAPQVALLLPVHDPAPGLLDRTLASVFAQTIDDWALCICDDGSTDPLVRGQLERAAQDPRVELVRHEQAQGISGATNAALQLASAPYVATLDHDDLLAPDALERVGAELARWPRTDLLYTDNDLIAGGQRFAAALKPDWSPDLFRACMYTLHLSVYRRALVEQVGGWRSAFDGAQDHDLVLRLTERTEQIRHVPRILAHWRAHAGSAALGELAKPTAYERGRDAVAEHLQRVGHTDATVERLPQPGRYRVRYPRTWPVLVRITVRGDVAAGELRTGVEAVLAALRADDRLQLEPRGDADDDVIAQTLAELDDPRLDPSTGPAPGATLLLDGPLAPDSAEAIDELVGHLEAGAAAAGGLVLDDAGVVVAGGVAFPSGLPVPLHPGADPADAAAHPSLTMVTNRLAVAGAVAVPGVPASGSDPVAVSLAASASGRVVWSPHARFTAGPAGAAWLLATRTDELLALDRGARPDPFWNPQRWAHSGAEVVPESVHENPLLDVPDA